MHRSNRSFNKTVGFYKKLQIVYFSILWCAEKCRMLGWGRQKGFLVFKSRAGCSPLWRPSSSITELSLPSQGFWGTGKQGHFISVEKGKKGLKMRGTKAILENKAIYFR